jgi:hypothetical protein
MRRKRRSTIIKNIESVNMEIDYDKLAEAIVKANNKQNTEHTKQEEINLSAKEKFRILRKGIVQIIKCKNKTENALTTGVFAILVSFLFRAVALFGAFAFVVLMRVLYDKCCGMTWIGLEFIPNIFVIATIILIGIAILMYSLMIWGSATEIENEKDKNYIISVFSGIVTFVALIVALIALKNDM